MYEITRQITKVIVSLLVLVASMSAFAANPQFVEELVDSTAVASVQLDPPSPRLYAIAEKYGYTDVPMYSSKSLEAPAYATGKYVVINDEFFASDEILTFVVLHEIGHFKLQHTRAKATTMAEFGEAHGVEDVGAFIDAELHTKLPASIYEQSRAAEYEADRFAFDILQSNGELKYSYLRILSFLLSADPVESPTSSHPAGHKRAKVLATQYKVFK